MASHATPLPPTVDALTLEVLQAVVGAQPPGAEPSGFEIASTSHAGEGAASTADRVQIRLEYGDERPDGAPQHLVYKTVIASQRAPTVMYETEVRFYDEIRPDLAIETPRCFGTAIDRTNGRFAILLEDLADRAASFPSAATSLTTAHVETVLSNLAALHAHYWRSDRFDDDLAWVPTPITGGMFDVFDTIGFELISDQLERHPFKAEMIAPLDRSFDSMWDQLWAYQTEMAAAPTTLLHGDTHVGNTYLLPDGSAGFLDWQLMVRGRWAHDVIYLLPTSMDRDLRRRHQEDLLRGYLAELRGHGVAHVPDEAHAWELCRQAALWGLVIGWLITPPENYGPVITTANLERVIAVVDELGSLR